MSQDPKQADMVRRAINAETTDELEVLYDDWADTYNDYLEGLSYVAPTIGATLLAQSLSNKETKILDVGCGTGLVELQLKERGFSQLDGTELGV